MCLDSISAVLILLLLLLLLLLVLVLVLLLLLLLYVDMRSVFTAFLSQDVIRRREI
jgi:hypothetical protein